MIAWLAAGALAEAPCAGCHGAIHAEWATSRHATAYTNPAFQAAWGRWRDPWCAGCHEPDDGVGCADCHVQEGRVATPTDPTARGEAAHAMVVRDLGTRVCVPCHQFDAPGGGDALQTTGDEHAAWLALGPTGPRGCADCHGGGHAVPRSVDPGRLRQAVSAVVWRGEGGVEAVVSARGLGHRFPTGDPWRRLVLELLDGDDVAARWRMGRQVTGVDADFHEVSDGRLPLPDASGASSLALVPKPGGTATRWRLRYERVDPSHAELPPGETGFVVAEGGIAEGRP